MTPDHEILGATIVGAGVAAATIGGPPTAGRGHAIDVVDVVFKLS